MHSYVIIFYWFFMYCLMRLCNALLSNYLLLFFSMYCFMRLCNAVISNYLSYTVTYI